METFGRVMLSTLRKRFVCFHDCISAVETVYPCKKRLPINDMGYVSFSCHLRQKCFISVFTQDTFMT